MFEHNILWRISVPSCQLIMLTCQIFYDVLSDRHNDLSGHHVDMPFIHLKKSNRINVFLSC